MRYFIFMVFLFSACTSEGQHRWVDLPLSVRVMDHLNVPLDKFHRVFFYRGAHPAYTENLDDNGTCELLITSKHVDTLSNEQGVYLSSTWNVVVWSPDNTPIHSETIEVDLTARGNLPIIEIKVNPSTQTVYGVVSDTRNRDPLSKVQVQLAKSAHHNFQMTETNELGYFKFEGLPLGEYALEFRLKGKRIVSSDRIRAFVPNPNPLDLRVEVLPAYGKLSYLPVVPMTDLNYRPSRFLLAGEVVSLTGLVFSGWRYHQNCKNYEMATTQQMATKYYSNGQVFKTTFLISTGAFLTFYITKLIKRGKHKP